MLEFEEESGVPRGFHETHVIRGSDKTTADAPRRLEAAKPYERWIATPIGVPVVRVGVWGWVCV